MRLLEELGRCICITPLQSTANVCTITHYALWKAIRAAWRGADAEASAWIGRNKAQVRSSFATQVGQTTSNASGNIPLQRAGVFNRLIRETSLVIRTPPWRYATTARPLWAHKSKAKYGFADSALGIRRYAPRVASRAFLSDPGQVATLAECGHRIPREPFRIAPCLDRRSNVGGEGILK
jgi:hypothetical protein